MKVTKRETLTDEDRETLSEIHEGVCALRIIDAHEAINAHMSANIAALKHDHETDRAALVKERDEAREAYRLECKASDIARAEVARLTQALGRNGEELAEVIRQRDDAHRDIARLTEALQTYESVQQALCNQVASAKLDFTESYVAACKRAEAAEQKLAAKEHLVLALSELKETLQARIDKARGELGGGGSSYGVMSRIANARNALNGK